MMGAGEQEQVVAGQSFAARIAGMGLHGQLSLSQPTAQGFAINAKPASTFMQSDNGHRTTPFVLQVTRTTTGRENSRQFSGDRSQECSPLLAGRFPGDLLGVFPRKVPGNTSSGLREAQASTDARERQGLASFLAAPTMIVAGPILMGASPPRPLTDQGGRGGGRPDEAGQQVTDFGGGQRNDGWSRHGHWGGR